MQAISPLKWQAHLVQFSNTVCQNQVWIPLRLPVNYPQVQTVPGPEELPTAKSTRHFLWTTVTHVLISMVPTSSSPSQNRAEIHSAVTISWISDPYSSMRDNPKWHWLLECAWVAVEGAVTVGRAWAWPGVRSGSSGSDSIAVCYQLKQHSEKGNCVMVPVWKWLWRALRPADQISMLLESPEGARVPATPSVLKQHTKGLAKALWLLIRTALPSQVESTHLFSRDLQLPPSSPFQPRACPVGTHCK